VGEGEEASLRCVSCVAWSFSSSVYVMDEMDRLQLCFMVTPTSYVITRYDSIGVLEGCSYRTVSNFFFFFFVSFFLRDGVELIEEVVC